MGDYLWDKDGAPDAEIEHLEQLLAPLAYRGPAPLPPRRPRRVLFLAAGAAVAASALLVVLLLRGKPPQAHDDQPQPARVAALRVTWSDRAPGRPSALHVGEAIETGDAKAQLHLAELGTIELAPHTRARLVSTSSAVHRLHVDSGALVAKIVAPPRAVVIETRYAVATDLGCAFELTVDEVGRGRLAVEEGAVGLAHLAGPELRVPAGAECTFSEDGTSLVTLSSASASLRKLFERRPQPRALRAALKSARPDDLRALRFAEEAASGEARVVLRERVLELEASERRIPKHTRDKKHVEPKHLGEPKTTMPQHTPIAPDAPLHPTSKATVPTKAPSDKLRHDSLHDLGKSMP